MNEEEEINQDVEPDAPTSVDEPEVITEEVPAAEKAPKKPLKKRKKTKKKPVVQKEKEPEVDEVSFDVKALREEVKEISVRAKEAGLNPLRQMVRSYMNTAFDAVDGLLSALEGDNRKKGK